MIEKIAFIVELSEIANEFDLLGKFAEADMLMNAMEQLVNDINNESIDILK